MRLTRIHVPGPLAPDSEITLPPQAGEHLTRVLRLEPGAAFTLFDGRGGEYAAQLAPRSGKSARARVLAHAPVERESPLDITLLQGIARGERMDLIVQKSTELGVTRIVPVTTERSVVRVEQRGQRKRDHWQSIAISACEQCGRNRIPEVELPRALQDALAALAAGTRGLLLAADAAASLASAARVPRAPLALLIGPEGGLADDEVRLAVTHGFTSCRLGPRVMRTETAGLAALAALQAIAGDFTG